MEISEKVLLGCLIACVGAGALTLIGVEVYPVYRGLVDALTITP